jgi:hypothetical protein
MVMSGCTIFSLLENLHSRTTDFWSGVMAWSLREMSTSGATNPFLDTGLGLTITYKLENESSNLLMKYKTALYTSL